ncbi:hypothetical protein DEJ49_31745 [Streptomyces venezuelae]|uniref:Lipoprotein n=1 Tax=Streptomyces venezuelae TaxID=54571 RepID=A0A5P2CV37_STRVZ|nr:hypothetical protein [Streptomyces venezuelae]QES44961.1 hypothetical protein DEJ49_31745 [Streptomyces venezuelae]
MRFTTGGTTRAVGVGVLVLSLALTGCGGKKDKKKHKRGSSTSHGRTVGGHTGGKGTGGSAGTGSLSAARRAQAILPPLDTMPTALRHVGTELHSRAKAPSVCEDPGGKCKGAVANGRVGYLTGDKTEGASYELIAYKNTRAAERAFAAWESYAHNAKREITVLDGAPQGSESTIYAYKTPAKKNTVTMVIRQDEYIGTLDLRDTSGRAAGRKDLAALSEVYAERLAQATRNETPSATAAHVKV